jgi:hypothetical protein
VLKAPVTAELGFVGEEPFAAETGFVETEAIGMFLKFYEFNVLLKIIFKYP